MQTITVENKSRKVIASRNDENSMWNARLYVGNGEVATLVCGKFKTESGLRKWAERKLK